jgi:hypothetical protein
MMVACMLLATVLAGATGCGGGAGSPRSTLRAYAEALEAGDADRAWALLSKEARASVPRETFRELVKRDRREALELGRALGRETGEPYVTAEVPLATGDKLVLVLEDGRWRVDASALDFYSQATPRHAIAGFVRAFDNQRWDVLLRYTPDAHREGLTPERLAAAWGRDKPEGKLISDLVEAIKQALPTATIEETGDRATMVYGNAGTVLFVREGGSWKIEDLK